MPEVLVGNRCPKVGRKQPDDSVVYEVLPPGEYVTVVKASDLTQVVGALTLHFCDGDKPVWVSCSDKGLEGRLVEYYGIEINSVPDEWNRDAD
jgi:hypothetical protein